MRIQGQAADRWRESVGEARAAVVEALCRVLFPDDQLRWGQHLTLLKADGSPVALALPEYAQRKPGNEWHGATGLEIGF